MTYALTGMVDEVAVYNRPLSEEEIKEAMKGFSSIGVDPKFKLPLVWGALKAR